MSCYEEDFPIDYCKECVHAGSSECHWCQVTENGQPTMFETFDDFLYQLAVDEYYGGIN